MRAKNSTGWVLLIAVLAVPGVLFYRWYSHLHDARKQELSLKVRTRLPADGPFSNSQNKDKLVNPMAAPATASTAAAAAPPAEPAQPVSQTPLAPVPVQDLMQSALTGKPDIAAVRTDSAPAAAAGPAAEDFTLWRDPMLSPYDLVRIKQEQEDARRRQEEIRRASQPRRESRRRAQTDPRQLVNLQGIVSGGGSANRAIVNGEVVREGQTISGVKVLRITTRDVTFSYKKKQFTKSVNR
jgi:hypothetical protein